MREILLGPDPNQVTSVLLFAASTSRQLRAVSEGPRRGGKGAKAYHTWLEANCPKAFYVRKSRASGGRQDRDLEFEASVAAYVTAPTTPSSRRPPSRTRSTGASSKRPRVPDARSAEKCELRLF